MTFAPFQLVPLSVTNAALWMSTHVASFSVQAKQQWSCLNAISQIQSIASKRQEFTMVKPTALVNCRMNCVSTFPHS